MHYKKYQKYIHVYIGNHSRILRSEEDVSIQEFAGFTQTADR